jgi:hypothetical protein
MSPAPDARPQADSGTNPRNSGSTWRTRLKRAFVFSALVLTLASLPPPAAQAQTPAVPAGFELVDLVSNNGYENPAAPLGFEAFSDNDGAVARTTVNPLAGTGSLAVTVQSYGRVGNFTEYGYGSGPFARSVTLAAKLRVDSATVPGTELTVCTIAYFLDTSEPSQVCQDFAVDPSHTVDVYLSLPTNDRQLNYLFPQFALNDSGTIQATVDDVHYYVVQPLNACTSDTWSCTDWSTCASDGTQTRTCTMTFDCPSTATPSPATTQSCTQPTECTADTWSCTDWSACAFDGTQTRTCTKTFDCPNASTPSPATTQSCTQPPPGGGPTNPSRSGGRYVAMMSPTNGESFWTPSSSTPARLRLVAQGFDPNISTNEPSQGHGQNASQLEFFVDGTSVLTVNGANAEYSVFKGSVDNVALTSGQHLVWARATYVNPATVLDSPALLITVADAPSYAQTIDLSEDVVLSSLNPSYQLQGTPAARIRLNGHGFQIRGTGNLTLRNVDVYDLGSRTNGLADAIDLASSGAVVIEGSTFDSSNQISLQLNGTATASIRRNTFRSNSRIPIGQQPFEPDTAHMIEISGNSTGTKTFAGNNVAAGAVGLANANHWMLGGTSNADSNVLIGVRAAFELQNCSDVTIEGNFVRNVYFGGWSQGQLMELGGSHPIGVLHNVLIGSSWPVRGIAGELAYNLIANGGHTSAVPDDDAYIHHNIFLGCGGDGGDCNWGTIGGVYDVHNVRVVNNTFDLLNQGSVIGAVYLQQGAASVRSNSFVRIPIVQNDPNAAVVDLIGTATLDADYNAFYGPRTKRYGDGRVPAHDLTALQTPNFTGPLPTTSMEMDQVAVWNRQLAVGAIVGDYRTRYTPASGTALIDSGDPAGGAGNDIGAIGSGVPNALDLFGTFGTNAAATKPTTPQNLYAAGISPTTIFLKWSPSASPVVPGEPQRSVASYRVFRDGAQVAVVTTALRYQDNGLAANSSHTYAIAAVDSTGKISASATATASTLPNMPVGAASSHPVLIPQGQLASLAAGGAAWTAQKNLCDSQLDTLIGAGYAGWDWHDAAVNYSTCYQVARLQNDTVNAQKYAKKALAMALVLARHHNYGNKDEDSAPGAARAATLQPLGLTDGARTTFSLPFTPKNAAQVEVFLTATSEIHLTRASQGNDNLDEFAPIVKISNTSGGAAAYAASDYELRYRDGSDTYRLVWTGSNHPAANAGYFVTVANGHATSVGSGFTIDSTNLTLTFNTAPAANQAVMVSYLGSAYEQTGNNLGGVNGVQPDGPGYQMRTFNPGLATAYDALLDSGLLTPALKTELYDLLNRQVDWCTSYCFENDGRGGNVGNYFIRGLLGGTFATAYATDGENPRALQLKAQANTLLAQMVEGIVKFIPGGYGPQGQYANGTTIDILQFLSLYRDVTALDLTPRLDWTQNVVAATIHGTKPNLTSFYDGGDWDNLPAYPLNAGMQGFLQYQPAHATAPFARKLVQELGETPVSTGTVTDYRNSFGLSYFGQGAPFYARSDWGANAVWMSLTSNDTGAVAHQHKDAGHFTIQRGGDYLLKNAGGYGFLDTVFHNTLLIDDRNIPGYTPVSVYPPDQGWWGNDMQLTKHADTGAYAYSQADFGDAYLNNDSVRNSVKRALRSIVFLRPGTFVVFDQVQTAHAAIRKTFNLNFGGTLTNQSGIWSTAVGQSKLFLQPLLNSATPVVSQLNGPDGATSANFQETLTGNLRDVFLHVFQAADASVNAMTTGTAMHSVDRNVQGVAVTANGKKWAVLFAAYDRTFAGDVQYLLPTSGAHGHIINDLLPLTAYVASVTNAQGDLQRSINATTDANGTLTFDTQNGESYLYLSPGTTPPSSIPPVTSDPNV